MAGLYYSPNDAIVDVLGVFDCSSVNAGWDVDSVINATQNHTMFRSPDVCAGNIGNCYLSYGSSSPLQWIVGVIDALVI